MPDSVGRPCAVEDGDCGETKNPAAGKVELHGHAGASAGARAHDFYSGEVAHDDTKLLAAENVERLVRMATGLFQRRQFAPAGS